MTLIVSVRSAEGIVVAGDTLASGMAQIPFASDLETTCPRCGERTTHQNLPVASINMPLNSFPSSRKVFPFFDRFGIGTFGVGIIEHRTPFFAIRQMEEDFKVNRRLDPKRSSLEDAADAIARHMAPKIAADSQIADDDIVGFHINGYANGGPQTRVIGIKGDGTTDVATYTEIYGYTTAGDESVVRALHQLSQTQGAVQHLSLVSLGDAVHFAEYLIRTTIDHQRFGSSVPTVGGNIDVGHVTPHAGYTWIRRSPDFLRHHHPERTP